MLDLEFWASGSILTGGNILFHFLFWHSKASDANSDIIAYVVCLRKPRLAILSNLTKNPNTVKKLYTTYMCLYGDGTIVV